jgi:hypothetical protein
MSKVKIQGNLSGTGIFTVAAPATNTDRTITLPDEAGTILTNVSNIPKSIMPTGSVINVWTVEKTDVWSKSGWGFSDITGLSITLTPTSASSKFLINYNVRATSDYYKSYVNLLRNGTVLFANADGAGDGRFRGTSTFALLNTDTNAHGFMHPHSLTLLDSPATTSSITYKLQGSGRSSSNIMYVNRSVPDRTSTEYDDRLVSNMVIQEIV